MSCYIYNYDHVPRKKDMKEAVEQCATIIYHLKYICTCCTKEVQNVQDLGIVNFVVPTFYFMFMSRCQRKSLSFDFL